MSDRTKSPPRDAGGPSDGASWQGSPEGTPKERFGQDMLVAFFKCDDRVACAIVNTHLYFDRKYARVALKKRKLSRHMRAVYVAVRDFACKGAFLYPFKSIPFRLPKRSPCIVIVGDDFGDEVGSRGPDGFEPSSLRDLLSTCGHVSIVATAPLDEPYDMAASFAARRRRNTAVIETQPEHVASWMKLAQACNPDVNVAVSKPRAAQ